MNSVKVEDRILVLAPTGQDAELTVAFLIKAGFKAQACRDMFDLAHQIQFGCGAVAIAEEALGSSSVQVLVDLCAHQPSWSDLPITIVTSGAEATEGTMQRLTVFGPTGNVTFLERPFRPLTLVNTMQAALRSRRRQYQVRDLLEQRETILQSINDIFVTLDKNWRYTYVNEQAATASHLTVEKMLGQSIWDLFPHLAESIVAQEMRRAMAENVIVQLEHLNEREQKWLDLRIYPSSNGIAMLATDITARKKVEIAFQAAKDQLSHYATDLEKTVAERTAKLEETISELEAFSYSVSHDLRAPLRAMQNYSQFLMEDFAEKLNGEGREYINRIINASNRLDRLIQDILTYSRATRSDITIQPVDLEKLVTDIIQHYPPLQPPTAKIDLQLPLLGVLAHEASLTQCISNLLVNAVKFVAPGVVPEVKVWTEMVEDQVRINFQDNGIGIDPHYQNRIFKMFERAVPEGKYEGTGIGLAIVRKAVERMGGSVGVKSELGKGSKFWIQLPKG
ncbi:sensor histidine kinase [Pedosphaera parvula]|uniref:histidine kinase n=1 Tax=Pedosphaera parvula (strain Ellin514) TaxID=320771 RepID=B9XJU0_PEDPL|nr:ATP-binding protein [Pedosphaera parvula]EEF59966.1 PAS/PAC sensor signal transduction histidine kinase [Pedosphaera parvula Ellin514]